MDLNGLKNKKDPLKIWFNALIRELKKLRFKRNAVKINFNIEKFYV